MTDRLALRLHLGALAPLTVEELAEVFGCRADAIRDVIDLHHLRPVKPARAKLYLYGEVLEAMRAPDPGANRATVGRPVAREEL